MSKYIEVERKGKRDEEGNIKRQKKKKCLGSRVEMRSLGEIEPFSYAGHIVLMLTAIPTWL